ncbi:UNVERIFIED_CONTAM: hypothetical protein FKN15_039585 [Acipenser sinensis]
MGFSTIILACKTQDSLKPLQIPGDGSLLINLQTTYCTPQRLLFLLALSWKWDRYEYKKNKEKAWLS